MELNEYEHPVLRKITLLTENGYAASNGNECEDIENGGSF